MMAITKKISTPLSQLKRGALGSGIQLSEALAINNQKSLRLPAMSSNEIFESRTTATKATKPKKSRISLTKSPKQLIPKRRTVSESQCVHSGQCISNDKRGNPEFVRKNAVNSQLAMAEDSATNKQVIEHNDIAPETSETQPITNEDASNNKSTGLEPNIFTPDQSVLLPNENDNLTVNRALKAKVRSDGITLTLDTSRCSHADVNQAAKDMCAAAKDGLHLVKISTKRGDRYKYIYLIVYGKKKIGHISLEPTQGTHIRFMRVVFNPGKIGASGCRRVAQAIYCIVGANAQEIINRANITRLDFAVDLYGIDLNSLLYFSARPIHSCTWGKIFKHGQEEKFIMRMETQYVGSPASDYYFSVYEKRLERIAKSGSKDDPGQRIVRVELRMKPRQISKGSSESSKSTVQFGNLESFDNPFRKLSITNIPTPDKHDGQFALFVYAAQHVGAQAALAMLKNPKKRAEYRKLLLGQASSCWKPDEYWARAISAFKKTLASIS